MAELKHSYQKYQEALRLIHKFFPESKAGFSEDYGMGIHHFLQSSHFCDWKEDFSCDPFSTPPLPNVGLLKKGGFEGKYDIVFNRLLQHANFHPNGRCICIPDTIDKGGWENSSTPPIICNWETMGERLSELEDTELFDASSFDTLFVFESGEAMIIDHDNRFFWGCSKMRAKEKTHL